MLRIILDLDQILYTSGMFLACVFHDSVNIWLYKID